MSRISNINTANREVIIRPHVTEKAGLLTTAKAPAYIFNVTTSATKTEVAAAIKRQYKVTPVKIAMITKPRKKMQARGRKGFTPIGKKAVVYLKAGDTITIA